MRKMRMMANVAARAPGLEGAMVEGEERPEAEDDVEDSVVVACAPKGCL